MRTIGIGIGERNSKLLIFFVQKHIIIYGFESESERV